MEDLTKLPVFTHTEVVVAITDEDFQRLLARFDEKDCWLKWEWAWAASQGRKATK